MSTKALSWAFQQIQLKPMERVVLLVLADAANDKNECWPSYQQISKISNITRRSSIEAVKRLQESGLIKLVNNTSHYGGSEANIYCLQVGEL